MLFWIVNTQSYCFVFFAIAYLGVIADMPRMWTSHDATAKEEPGNSMGVVGWLLAAEGSSVGSEGTEVFFQIFLQKVLNKEYMRNQGEKKQLRNEI